MASKVLKATFYILFLAIITLGYANSARILDEATSPLPTTVLASNNPTTPLPSGQIPATATVDDNVDNSEVPIPNVDAPVDDVTPPVDVPSPVVPPVIPAVPEADSPQPEEPVPTTVPAPITGPTIPSATAPIPIAGPAIPALPAPLPVETPVAVPATTVAQPHLAFFMHDILGGSHPSVRVVTGLIANTVANVPFSKPNNNIFPVTGGTPINNNNLNGFLNNNRNNLPSIAGLTGTSTGLTNSQTSTVIQNSGNNNIVDGGSNQPFVTAGQLPNGATLQKLMFGSITVIDDELTEGHELGSPVLGKAQGFYLASSLDGNSHTMAFTVLMHGAHDVEDTISLFGVHRTAAPVSHIAVIGGTGKYENANGYAAIESLVQEDQHTTDGVDTIMQISVYLSE
ncbi:dirigent protein 24-like [Argentina anserina]|uniref:dirigent protein 24-like n=1 Tax=Argentina anserina TaxID=57926 RepID=UPI00217690BD|nr:dirigent protein 24-like [Potentilla anserina]